MLIRRNRELSYADVTPKALYEPQKFLRDMEWRARRPRSPAKDPFHCVAEFDGIRNDEAEFREGKFNTDEKLPPSMT